MYAGELIDGFPNIHRALWNAAMVGLSVTDRDGVYRMANPAYCRMFGYRQDEIVGKVFYDVIVPEESRERYKILYRQMCDMNVDWESTFLLGQLATTETMRRKDGSPVIIEFSIVHIYKDRKPEYIVSVVNDVTARRQAEDELRDSEALFRLLLESAEDGILLADASSRQFFYGNAAIRRMLGYESGEISKLAVHDIHPAESVAAVEKRFDEIAGGKVNLVGNIPCLRRDGSVFIAEINASRATIGNRECVIGIFRDVTERQQAEADRLRLNRALTAISSCGRALVHASDETELLKSICRVIVEDAGYLLAWVGYKVDDETKSVRPMAQAGYEDGYLDGVQLSWADEEKGRGPTGTAIREGRRVVASNLNTDPSYSIWREQAAKRGYASSIALPLKLDGITIGALNIYASEPDAFDEEEVRMLSEMADDLSFGIRTLRETDARRNAEIARWASEQKYSVPADAAVDEIFIIARDGTLQYVNRAVAKAALKSIDEMVGARLADIIPADIASKRMLNVEEVYTSGRPLSIEEKYSVHGREVWLSIRLSPVRNEAGDVVSVLGIGREITEQKRLEQAKINFLSSISHELRTPLSLILGYSEVLMREKLPQSVRNKLRIIHDRGKQELRLVEELITLAMFESGKVSCDLQDVRIWDFLKQYTEDVRLMIENMVQKRYRDAGYEYVRKISGELRGAVVRCDPKRLCQVLDNLLENAVKYSEKDSLCFHIEAELKDGNVVVEIRDRGIGIPPGEVDLIFKPFYQIRTGANPISDGMGKGLSIVREYIEVQGGKVWVESEVDRGSAFYLSLPVKEFTDHVSAPAVRKIMIVDDDLDIVELVEEFLRAEDFEVHTAVTAGEAMEKISRVSPDLVLLDIQLPDGDGLELCRELKRGDKGSSYIYLFSAKSKDALREMAERVGADGYVSKPFEIDAFIRQISHLRSSD